MSGTVRSGPTGAYLGTARACTGTHAQATSARTAPPTPLRSAPTRYSAARILPLLAGAPARYERSPNPPRGRARHPIRDTSAGPMPQARRGIAVLQTSARAHPAAKLTSHAGIWSDTDPVRDHPMPPSAPMPTLLLGVLLRSSGHLRACAALLPALGGRCRNRYPHSGMRGAVTLPFRCIFFVGTPSA